MKKLPLCSLILLCMISFSFTQKAANAAEVNLCVANTLCTNQQLRWGNVTANMDINLGGNHASLIIRCLIPFLTTSTLIIGSISGGTLRSQIYSAGFTSATLSAPCHGQITGAMSATIAGIYANDSQIYFTGQSLGGTSWTSYPLTSLTFNVRMLN